MNTPFTYSQCTSKDRHVHNVTKWVECHAPIASVWAKHPAVCPAGTIQVVDVATPQRCEAWGKRLGSLHHSCCLKYCALPTQHLPSWLFLSFTMSLLFDLKGQPKPTLTALWREAHKGGGQEAEALSFWQHYLSKHEFKEEHWICDAEIRPQPGSQSRIDRGVRFLGKDGEIIVLCWLEAKGGTSPSEKSNCEKQALNACITSLKDHPWQRHVYALTTAKTEAKAWTYERGDPELTALFDDSYVEANSSEGYKISKSLQKMKSLPPAEVTGDPNSMRMMQNVFDV
jgi:hypothetical protein